MNLDRHPNFPSSHVPARNIDVWLPPNLDQDSEMRCPVIYMHDGQNLFYPEESFIGVDWGIDKAVRGLIDRKEIRPPIVVGIWNTANRVGEYMPELALPTQEDREQTASRIKSFPMEISYQLAGESYLKFIVKELKPWIDLNYPTLPGQPYTSIMGSSMGGLISLYALCRYPNVFFGAGCLSAAWDIATVSLLPYFESALPDPSTHRIYMDMGGREFSDPEQDHQLQEIQSAFDHLARRAGYRDNHSLLSLTFPNHEHSELFWRARVDIPIQFLLEQGQSTHSWENQSPSS
jgi:predicted alpha/beta superfamily hydrolase